MWQKIIGLRPSISALGITRKLALRSLIEIVGLRPSISALGITRKLALRSLIEIVGLIMLIGLCSLPLSIKLAFGYSHESLWWTHFSYHFFHVNLLHLLINTVALYDLLKREVRSTRLLFIAYICSSIASFIDTTTTTTIGISGLVFSVCAIRVSQYIKVKPLLISLLALSIPFFMCGANPYIHLYSYILGFACGPILNLIDKYNHDIRGNTIRK